MNLIADVFPQLTPLKNVVRSISKKLCFTGPFDRQYGKWVVTLLLSEDSTFTIFSNHF